MENIYGNHLTIQKKVLWQNTSIPLVTVKLKEKQI